MNDSLLTVEEEQRPANTPYTVVDRETGEKYKAKADEEGILRELSEGYSFSAETHNVVGEGFVVRDWLKDLPWKQQTVLLSAIRGCDGVSKHDPSKQFVRPLRGIILKNAEPGNKDDTFMHHPDEDKVEEFAHRLDDYPMHWLVHFMHAVEIVGYKHPDKRTQMQWRKLYNKMCKEGFHLNPESEKQLDERLQP